MGGLRRWAAIIVVDQAVRLGFRLRSTRKKRAHPSVCLPAPWKRRRWTGPIAEARSAPQDLAARTAQRDRSRAAVPVPPFL